MEKHRRNGANKGLKHLLKYEAAWGVKEEDKLFHRRNVEMVLAENNEDKAWPTYSINNNFRTLSWNEISLGNIGNWERSPY